MKNRIVGLGCVVFFFLSPAWADLTNGLVAYYPFSGNANDATGNGNNGTVNGVTLTTDRFGNLNSAYAFPGIQSSNITVNSTNLLLQMPFSYSVWVDFSGGYFNPRVLGVATSGGGYEIATDGTGSSRSIGLDVGTTGGVFTVFSADSFAAGVWHQLLVVCDTNNMTLYVDGKADGATAVQGQMVYTSGFGTQWLPTIGGPATFGDPNDLFAGAINDVRLYNRALSSNEVAQLYAIESIPFCVPHGATATATVVSGFVVAANITNEGCGYSNAPTVYIIGGGGIGAQATATVTSGAVTHITIVNAGSGYTNVPTIAIAPPSPLALGIALATRLNFTNLIIATHYQLQLSQSGTWNNLDLPFPAVASSNSLYVDGSIDSTLGRLVALPIPYGATATPIVYYGFLVAATVNNGGAGYVSVPAVQIIGGGGNGAEATSTVSNGVVTAINIFNAGFGYTNPPTIQIDPPPILGLVPIVNPAFRLDYNGLTPTLTYHLQASPDLTGWTNSGRPFIAAASASSQYFDFRTNNFFYRLLSP